MRWRIRSLTFLPVAPSTVPNLALCFFLPPLPLPAVLPVAHSDSSYVDGISSCTVTYHSEGQAPRRPTPSFHGLSHPLFSFSPPSKSYILPATILGKLPPP